MADGDLPATPDLKTVKELSAQNVANRHPEVTAALVKERADAVVTKRIDSFRKALDVIVKLRSDRNKADKPDVPGTVNSDGTPAVVASYTAANRKSVKELGDKIKSVEDAYNTAWVAWAGGGATDAVDQSFQKLNQAADKASKGAKGDAGESDAA